MTKNNTEKDEKQSEFEKLLNEYDYSYPKRGEVIEGEIEMIDDDSIILDVGLKRAAQVVPREVKNLDEELFENLSVGDVIPIYVTNRPVGDEALLVSINKTIEHQNWQEAEELVQRDEEISLNVTGMNKGGLLVQFEQLEGFIPNSHIPELTHTFNKEKLEEEKNEMIGSTLTVKPIEVDKQNNKLVFSAKLVEDGRRKERLEEISVGDVITGKVTNIVDFGVFVDLDGIDGLIHISELSWRRVDHPSSVVSVGEEIDVLVKDVNIKKERVSLSRKDIMPNPWEEFAENYGPGDLIDVEITDIVDFGAFAKLREGVQGLIHISELGYTQPEDADQVVESGETVKVKILSLDVDRQRVSLSMRQVPRDDQIEWMVDEDE
jgi:small subunit ribosomal protein S1